MDLNKCIIQYTYHSEILYCTNSNSVGHEKYDLLGFKGSIPVICIRMSEEKASAKSNKKTKVFKVEVDPQTGDKFINLIGRKIMIPESKPSRTTPIQEKNSQKISTSVHPLKFKVIKGFVLPNKPQCATLRLEKTNIDDAETVSEQLINMSSLSQKTLITSSELQRVKSPDSSNMTIKAVTLENTTPSSNMSSQVGTPFYSAKKNLGELKVCTSTSEQYLGALDLTKYSVKQNCNEDGKSMSDKYCQTDITSYSNVRPSLVHCGVQTETEDPIDFDIVDFLDLWDRTDECTQMKQWSPPKEINNFSQVCTPSEVPSSSMSFQTDSNVSESKKNLVVGKSDHTANYFFNELRNALLSDDIGNMPIHVGVLRNDLKTVKKCLLILKILQQSVDLPNNSDFTPLQLAIINRVTCDIINNLLSEGANLNVTDSEGNNILHLAVEYDRVDALPLILQCAKERGFNLDQHNHEGVTPLISACMNGQHDCAKFLLDFKADVNARDLISGRTSLFHAAENHDVEMVDLLLSYQAKTKVKNFFGTSPHDAMYEIEDMPDQIKTLIFAKNKRKSMEEPKPTKTRKIEDLSVEVKTGLKTISKYRKSDFPNYIHKMSVVK